MKKCLILFLFLFFIYFPKTHAATVLDTTASIVSNDYCLSDDGNNLDCAAYRYYFDIGDGYPIVSTGKLESITLKIHPSQYFYGNLSDFVGIKVEGTVLGQHICKSSTITYAYLNEHNNEWIAITFYCSPNDTVDFSREKLSVIYSAEYGGSLDFALTTEDLITPSRVPNGNFVATYCYLYPSPWCWWLGPITDRDVWMKITDMPQQAAKTPVLIVPGVLGTEIRQNNDDLVWLKFSKLISPSDEFLNVLEFNSDLSSKNDVSAKAVIRKVDPLGPFKKFDYTDGLINLFTSPEIGYTEGQDLFTFPYDWRFGVGEDIVNQLKGQIDYIINQTDAGRAAGKVGVIAHSTGGLIVKRYV